MASVFTNRHVVVAMLVAPVLAIIAWFAIDSLVAEKPQVAQLGQTYALASLPNCRYPSGHCTMKNEDFEVDIKPITEGTDMQGLELQSKHPLQWVKGAVVHNEQDTGTPVDFIVLDELGLKWQLDISGQHDDKALLRIAASANGSFYYGESGLAFVDYETGFGKDFR